MSPMRMFATQLAAIAENNEGTKATLNNNHVTLIKDGTFSPTVEMYARDLLRGSFSRDPSVSGAQSAKIAFTCEMVGQGNKGVAPYWGKYLQGCGFGENISANNSVTYTPITNNMTNSMTLGLYMDGVAKTIWGARGSVRMDIEAGRPGLLHFEFEGAGFEVTDANLFTGVTYPTLIPPTFLGVSLLLNSYAAVLGKVDIDFANTLAKRSSISSNTGYVSTLITGRNPKGSMDPELCLVATHNFYGLWKEPGTLGALTFSAGNNNGNILTITCPKVRYAAIADQDRNGLRTLGLDFEICANNGDDEISIVLT